MESQKNNKGAIVADQFHNLFDLSPEPILVINLNGKIIEINKVGFQYLGSKTEAFQKFDVRDLIQNFDENKFKKSIESIRSQKSKKNKVLIKTPQGENFAFEVIGKLINYEGDAAILLFTHDISKHYQFKKKLKNKSDELHAQNEEYLSLNEELNETNRRLSLTINKLELSENKFRTTFYTSPDSININRISDGFYLEVNQGFTQLTGFTSEDVKNKSSKDIHIWANPNDRQRLVEGLLKDGMVNNMEADFRLKDGTVKTGLMSARIIEVNNEKCILSVTRDITDIKQSIQKIKIQQEYLSSIIDTTKDGFWILDNSGKFIDVNQSFCKMIGYAKEEILKLSIKDIDAVEDQETTRKRIQRIKEYGHEIFETKHFKKDKSLIDIEVSSSYLESAGGQFICFGRDISDRKLAEQEISRMASILDLAPSAITVHDFKGNFLFSNQKNLEIHGYQRDELMQMNLRQIDVPESEALISMRMEMVKENGEASFEVAHFRKDGTIVPLLLYVKLIEWKGIPGLLSIGSDISELKKAQALLKESNQRNAAILEALPDLMFVLNKEGVYLDYFVNDKNKLLIPPEVFLNKNSKEVLPEYLYKINNQGLTELFRTGQPQNFSYSIEHNKKTNFFDGRMVKLGDDKAISIIRDVTEQKIAELRNDLLISIIDNSKDFIGVANIMQQAMYVNPAGQTMLGLDEEKVNETKIEDYFLPEDLDFLKTTIIPCVEKNGRWSGEFRLRHFKTGKPIHVLYDLFKTVDPFSGELINYSTVSRDISRLKEAEQTLRESETRFRTFAELAPVGIIISDKKEKALYISHKFTQIFGYTIEDIPTVEEWWKVAYPDENLRKQINNDWAKTMTNARKTGIEPKPLEYPVCCKNGQIKLTEFRLTSTNDLNFIVATDITERKNAEQALIISEENYRLLFNNMTQGFVLFDIIPNKDGNPGDYKYISANPAFEKLTGKKNSDIMGKTILEIVPDIERYWIDTYGKVATSGEPFYYENYARDLKKHFSAWVFSPKPHQIAAVFSDITERKIAEEKVQKLSKGIEQSPAMVIITDLQGMIEYVNPKFSEITGYSLEEAIGKTPSILKSGQHEQTFYKNLWDTIIRGSDWKGEILNKKKNGEFYWESVIISNIRNELGQITNYISVKEDITHRKNLEKELLAAKEKAEESDRLKTAFLQNMSHEIRTPLNAISGFSGMLNKPDLSEEKRKSFTSIIRNSSTQLISIVSDILTISSLETKQERLSIEKVCINNIILDLLAIFKMQAFNQNLSLFAKQDLNDLQSEVYTDKTKITQILTNLISNALKFTHEGTVEFGYVYCSEVPDGKSLQQALIKFYVKDTGIGIKPEFHEKIFERFHQADLSISQKYGGTGLGLSISKGFTELLGGKIWLESEPGKGTTFFFTIPYNPANEHTQMIPGKEQNNKVFTMLVAEDEEYNFLFIEELLNGMDLKLIHAKDGKETIDICRNNSDIHLVLMDIKMPLMDGHTAAQFIKKFRSDLPIVAQSAYALEHEIEKYRGIFDDYITKPIDAEILIKIVKQYQKQVNHVQ